MLKRKRHVEIVENATSNLFGDLEVCYFLNEAQRGGRKWNIQIDGFGNNWARIKVVTQDEGVLFKHFTVNNKK